MDSDGYDSDKAQPGNRDFDTFAPSLLSENTKQWFNFNYSSSGKLCLNYSAWFLNTLEYINYTPAAIIPLAQVLSVGLQLPRAYNSYTLKHTKSQTSEIHCHNFCNFCMLSKQKILEGAIL